MKKKGESVDSLIDLSKKFKRRGRFFSRLKKPFGVYMERLEWSRLSDYRKF